MSFKPDPPATALEALSGFGASSVAGRDAEAFLQAQTMNDVAALVPGHWHWNGWLTPKGRVIALFAVLRMSRERFFLLAPDYPADELRVALRRFVFRSKVAIDDAGLVAATGRPAPAATGNMLAISDDGAALAPDGTGRVLWLLPAASVGPPSAATDAAWRAADMAAGIPRLGPAQREAWTPQMLSLQRLGAYSLKKGCYPGQEIVARTHFLGQAKRGLAKVRGEDLSENDAVLAGDAPAGTIVCVTDAGDEALAVMSLDAEAPFFTARGPVTVAGLNGGHDRVP